MGLPLVGDDRLDDREVPALVVDAIFGTGLDRPVEGRPAEVIDWINRIMARGRPVLAVDVPSGLDCDTGLPLGHAVRATATVTFVARKPGLLEPPGRDHAGRVTVADIGAPRELVERFGRPVGSVCR
jgi:NAD(P)H-hydrate epimerase